MFQPITAFLFGFNIIVVLRHLLKESNLLVSSLFSRPYGWETNIIYFYFGMLSSPPSSEGVGFLLVSSLFPRPWWPGDRYWNVVHVCWIYLDASRFCCFVCSNTQSRTSYYLGAFNGSMLSSEILDATHSTPLQGHSRIQMLTSKTDSSIRLQQRNDCKALITVYICRF